MKSSVRTIPTNRRADASANTNQRSDGHAKYSQMRHTLRKTGSKTAATVQSDSKIRITRPAQLQIIALFMQGCSFCEIVRRTGYARQTITKVVRAPEVAAKMEEVKAIILGESDAWAESLHYAVTRETDGKMSYKLLKDFGLIPTAAESESRK